MSKKLPSLLSCLLLIPAVANALGLGPIKLHSALNQPLDASIQLLSVKDINNDDIKVKLASDNDFERVGVDKSFVLTMLNFKVVGDGDNRQIQITSAGRINDPYLRFLLDVSTPDGQFFRVYTVLLDPANYTPSSVASSAQSLPDQSYRRTTVQITSRPAATITNSYAMEHVTHAVTVTSPVTNQQQSIPASLATPAATPALSIQTHYGPIKANDTLYKIAIRFKTDNSMTVNQIMLAIVGANPEAFTNNNINLLKTGHTLSIPSAAVIKSIPADRASREVAQQDLAWHNHSQIKHVLAPPFYQLQADQNSAVPTLVPANTDNLMSPPANQEADQTPAESSIKPIYSDIEAAKNPQVPSSNVPIPAELQMRAPDANTIESSPLLQSSPQPTSSNEKNLQAELAISAGAVTAVQQSNQVLQQQIKALEEQNQQLQARMNNKDAQLKNLQDNLIQSQPQINQPLVQQASTSPATTTVNSNTAYINASATTAASAVITPAVAGQAVAEKNHQPRGWFSTFFLTFVILVGAVVAGITWLFNRQQRVGVKAANMYEYDDHSSRQGGDEQNSKRADVKQPFVATEVKPKKSSNPPEIVKPTVKNEAVQNNGQSSQRQAPVITNDTLEEDKNSIEYTPATIETDDSLQKSNSASTTFDEFAGKNEDLVATKLNLSVAYFNMEDYAAAKKLLQEVIQDGDEQQQKEAQELLNRIVN